MAILSYRTPEIETSTFISVSNGSKSCRALPPHRRHHAARKPRSNDTSGEFKSSVKDSKGEGMSMEQADRAQLKVCDSNSALVGLRVL